MKPFVRYTCAVLLMAAVGCSHELSGHSDLGDVDGAVLPGPSTGAACGGLTADDCRARPDCVPDYCTTCSCTPSYLGCRTPSDPPHDCPAFGCASPDCCTTAESCRDSQLTCFAPDQPTSGVPNEGNARCSTDAQCRIGTSCVSGDCVAQPDCPSPCGSGLVCDHDSSGAACVHTACTGNTDCERGFCVLGTCYRSLGLCTTPGI